MRHYQDLHIRLHSLHEKLRTRPELAEKVIEIRDGLRQLEEATADKMQAAERQIEAAWWNYKLHLFNSPLFLEKVRLWRECYCKVGERAAGEAVDALDSWLDSMGDIEVDRYKETFGDVPPGNPIQSSVPSFQF